MRSLFEIIDSVGVLRPRGVIQVGAHVGEEVELFFNNGISYAAAGVFGSVSKQSEQFDLEPLHQTIGHQEQEIIF